jgi:hypothetical protein
MINMVKKLIKCRGCGKDFWTKQIRVYVFKERLCSKCKSPMVKSDTGNRVCPKCGLLINPQTPEGNIAFGMLGLVMRGTSRNVTEAERMRQKPTIEVEKVLVDEAELCQNCQNFLTRRMQAMKNNERKGGGRLEPVGELSKEEVDLLGKQKISKEEIQAIQQDIQKKVNAEYQAKLREEQQKKAAEEADKKAREELEKKVVEELTASSEKVNK